MILVASISSCSKQQGADGFIGETKVEAEEIRVLRFELVSTSSEGPEDTLYGVFKFRYSCDSPISFWGVNEPIGNKFTPRFTS